MEVWLNDKKFVLKSGTYVQREEIQEFSAAIRMQSQQQASDRAEISTWSMSDWSGGYGCKRIRSEADESKFWYAQNVDTRWTELVRSPEFQRAVVTPSVAISDWFAFKNELYFIGNAVGTSYYYNWQFIGSAGGWYLFPYSIGGSFPCFYKFTPSLAVGCICEVPTVNSGSYWGRPQEIIAVDCRSNYFGVLANAILVLAGTLPIGTYGTPWGATIAAYGTIANVAINQYNYLAWFNFDNVGSANSSSILLDSDTSTDVGYYPPATQNNPQRIHWKGDLIDAGGTTSLAWMQRNTPSASDLFTIKIAQLPNFVIGSVRTMSYTDVVGTTFPELVTDGLETFISLYSGIFGLANNLSLVVDTMQSSDLNRAQAFYNGYLYFINSARVTKVDVSTSEVSSIGYELGDGISGNPKPKAMCAYGSWLFTVIGESPSQKILAYNGSAWHNYAEVPSTASYVKKIWGSSIPDGKDRLWMLFGDGLLGHYMRPLRNPQSESDYKYQVSVTGAYIDFPENFLDIPEVKTGLYGITHLMGGADAYKYVMMFFGIDGASYRLSYDNGYPKIASNAHFTYIGNSLASNSGVECYSVLPRIYLYDSYGSANGSSAIWRGAIWQYLKVPPKRERFSFVVDLEQTANAQYPIESVIDDIDSLCATRILTQFWYGQVPTKMVLVKSAPYLETINDKYPLRLPREGFVQMQVAEAVKAP